MRLENRKNEFPVMPDKIRMMVEKEVEKQLRSTEIASTRKKKGTVRRSFIAALVAAMALGTTVFAGAVYHMESEADGNFGVHIKTEKTETGQDGADEIVAAPELLEIQPVNLEVSYLPEGMTETDQSGKYCYEDAMYKGGVSICLYGMDTGDDSFEMSFKEVVSREEITVNGNNGVYLEFLNLFEDEISFNQRIYVAYPDLHYVMEMYIASDVTKEEAVKIAEGIRLVPAAEGEGSELVRDFKWSEYLASQKERLAVEGSEAEIPMQTVIEAEALKNTHMIGESFSVENTIPWEGFEGLSAKVSDVQVYDHIGVLDLSKDADLKKELANVTDAEGKLRPCVIQYIKNGDGTDTLSEIVGTKEVPQKLVYITLEYTNNGETEMTDILYMCGLMKLVEKNGQVEIYSGEQPGENDDWDVARINGPADFLEMYYWDVQGGEEGKNYIDSLKPGETAIVHVAWIVPEQDLGYLYLNLHGYPYEFSEESLATGYVDIRQ